MLGGITTVGVKEPYWYTGDASIAELCCNGLDVVRYSAASDLGVVKGSGIIETDTILQKLDQA